MKPQSNSAQKFIFKIRAKNTVFFKNAISILLEGIGFRDSFPLAIYPGA